MALRQSLHIVLHKSKCRNPQIIHFALDFQIESPINGSLCGIPQTFIYERSLNQNLCSFFIRYMSICKCI